MRLSSGTARYTIDVRRGVAPHHRGLRAKVTTPWVRSTWVSTNGPANHPGCTVLHPRLNVAASATLYPLGNRAILLHLERSGEELDATQRVFAMTLASQPFWWLIAAYAWHEAGPPPPMQMTLAMGVALFTGVIATVVFFHATGLVRNQPAALGAVEAMQAAELLFTSALGVLFLGEAIPQGWAALGALLVIAGIIALGVLVGRDAARDRRRQQVLRSDRGA